MKVFVYKTIFILIGIYILFQLTIGIKINHQISEKLEKLTSEK